MKARHQRRARVEGAGNSAPEPAADRMLEQPDRGPHIGDPIGGPPQEWKPTRDRSVERGQTAGDDTPVRHRIPTVDRELVGIAPADCLGYRLGGGAMPGTRVGKKKDE